MTQTTHQQQPDANDVLMGGGGAASATWEAPGAAVAGRIVSKPQSYHVRKYDRANPGGGPLAFYPSGDPIMGIRVDVQTADRLNADDDGVRRMYVEKKRQLAAVRDAVRAAGETGIQIGGHLSMSWTGLEDGDGAEPAKTWAATYKPPTVGVPAAPRSAPVPQPPATAYAQPQQQYAPAVTAPNPEQYARTQSSTYQPQPVGASTVEGAGVTFYAGPAMTAPAGPKPTNEITETMAAAMRNAGVDVTAFSIIAG